MGEGGVGMEVAHARMVAGGLAIVTLTCKLAVYPFWRERVAGVVNSAWTAVCWSLTYSS
jgi:hypothetical protein